RDEKKGLEQKPADERSWVEHGLALVRKPQPGRWLILPVGAVAGHAAQGPILASALASEHHDDLAALAAFEEALKLNPRYFHALQNKAAILSDKFHDDAGSEKAINEAVAWYPDSVLAVAGRGILLARRGHVEGARADAARALELDDQAMTHYYAACIYAQTSKQEPADRPRALFHLARALRGGYGLAIVGHDDDLDPIRTEPRFSDLVNAARLLASPR